MYVPVVTLSTENDKKLLEQLRTGFKRTIKWNRYRSEMTNQTKNNKLNYLIDPKFTKVNRLFILSFENKNDRTSFSKYYVINFIGRLERNEGATTFFFTKCCNSCFILTTYKNGNSKY